jgi:hypothetical protein
MTMCEAPTPSHAFLEHLGRQSLLVRGSSLGELAAEGARALGVWLCGGKAPRPLGAWFELSVHAGSADLVFAEWLDRLLALAEQRRWAPVECEILEASDTSLRGRVRGVLLPSRPGRCRAQLDRGLRAGGGEEVVAVTELSGPPCARPSSRLLAGHPQRGNQGTRGGTS